MDRGALLDERLLSLQHGKHTASLELVNRTTHHEHFMVFQHLVAFSTSGAEDAWATISRILSTCSRGAQWSC